MPFLDSIKIKEKERTIKVLPKQRATTNTWLKRNYCISLATMMTSYYLLSNTAKNRQELQYD